MLQFFSLKLGRQDKDNSQKVEEKFVTPKAFVKVLICSRHFFEILFEIFDVRISVCRRCAKGAAKITKISLMKTFTIL